MIVSLKNHIIFVHGLSGSGKGELYSKLEVLYSAHNYKVFYISSGELFRKALSNPVIAEQVRKGYFLDTLGAIMPEIEDVFENFVKSWSESDGKSVIILDGLIRRGSFTNKEGVLVPSQIEQISVGIENVLRRLVEENRKLGDFFPEYTTINEREEQRILTIKQTLKDAPHIIVDVSSKDAEEQIKIRADKEINSIRSQLQEASVQQQLNPEIKETIEEYILRFEAILHGGTQEENGGLKFTPSSEWNNVIEKNLYPLVEEAVKRARELLAHTVGLVNSATIAESLGAVGIKTELRDDDISSVGRQTRIANYIKVEVKDGAISYKPGFATQALSEELGVRLNPDGTLQSEKSNCLIITNGKSRGVSLEKFKLECKATARQLYTETELTRRAFFEGLEARISKERGG